MGLAYVWPLSGMADGVLSWHFLKNIFTNIYTTSPAKSNGIRKKEKMHTVNQAWWCWQTLSASLS